MLSAMAPLSDDAAAQRAQLITGLVGQLKRGELSKGELFSKLSALPGPEAHANDDVGGAKVLTASLTPAEENGGYANGTARGAEGKGFRLPINGLLSSEDRRAIIRKLIEEKRRRNAAAESLREQQERQGQHLQEAGTMELPLTAPNAQVQQHHQQQREEQQQQQQQQEGPTRGGSVPVNAWGEGPYEGDDAEGDVEFEGIDGGNADGRPPLPRRRQQRGGSDGGHANKNGGAGEHDYGSRGRRASVEKRFAVDGDAYRVRSFSEERMRRSEELVRRELMAECTFRPRIKELPDSYGALKHAGVPFLQRVEQWQADKERGVVRRASAGRETELEGCTFAPAINANSRRAAAYRLEDEGVADLPVDERLFDQSRRRRDERERMEREMRAREEEELERSCTFRPALATSPATGAPAAPSRFKAMAGIDNREMSGAFDRSAFAVGDGGDGGGGNGTRNASGLGANHNGVDGSYHFRHRPRPVEARPGECTFKPAVLGPRGEMPSARLYLQLDVVDRLTGSFLKEAEDAVAASGAQMGGAATGSGHGGSGGGSAAADGFGRDDFLSKLAGENGSDGDRQADGPASPDEKPSFREFLARQNHSIVRRQRQIESLSARSAPPFKPELCPGSRRIQSASGTTGDFLQRLAREAVRKEHSAVKAEARRRSEVPSFRPELTPRSRSMPSRTPVELSRGDQLRRDTAQRLAKLRAEQERLAGMTFQPALSGGSVAANARGRLRVLSEPDLYVKRVKEMRTRREEAARRAATEREARETAGCTFQPETTQCPAFVRRIARGAAAARAAAPPPPASPPVRPNWV